MTEICSKKECTGCGLCKYLCPKQCIKFTKDALGVFYPQIDEHKCISCRFCQKVCPSLQKQTANKPIYAYAAWSTNKNTRNTGASGGIAQEIYKWALTNNFCTYGVIFSKESGANYIKLKKIEDINKVKNSKYVYSNLDSCLDSVNHDLINNKKVVFIGLPCQIAAIKKLSILRHKENNVITIDLICHGTPPQSYLQEHLNYLEKKKNNKIENITFRNPNSSYRLTLRDRKGKEFYRKKPNEDDVYFRGFMSNLILKENCYNCHYATEKRISDITIGDFDGLKDLSLPEKKQISLVLSSTIQGQQLIENLIQNNKIKVVSQNVDLAMDKNKALHFPSNKHIKRIIFEYEYKEKGFERAAKIALKKELLQYKLMYIPNCCKYFLLSLIPRNFKDTIKQKIKRN